VQRVTVLAVETHVRDVILRDGSTLRLRPPASSDADRVLAFFEGLTRDSLYTRFHGLPALGPKLAKDQLDPDWVERGALIGTEDHGRVVAVASYARLRDPLVAEVAFAVADATQGIGVGTRLLEQLADFASGSGIETFVAEVLEGNRAMLGVLAAAGFEQKRAGLGGVIEVRLPIASTERYLDAVDDRDHTAVVASLRPFFEPRSVAVLGASARRGAIGGELFRNLIIGDFDGPAYPVNARGESVSGVPAFTSIEAVPEVVDLVVIALPGAAVLGAAEAALRTGVRALCVISAGFAETGPEGRLEQERLLELVRSYGGRIIGPNCLGIAVSSRRLNATFGPPHIPAGNIAFSSQSGALGLAFLQEAARRGIGLSSFVSIGNKADVSSNDLLELWEEDEATDLILLYLESFGNPRRFGRIARRVARRKPILAMKSGRSRAGARASASHTAALAGSDAAVDALFHQAGVIRADTLDQLLDVASLLATQPLPAGRNVAILTNAGGLGILCADACEAAGLELPALAAGVTNPVDLLGSATGTSYEVALPPLLADPGIDAVIVLFVPPVVAGAHEVAASIRRAVDGLETLDKPVLAVVMSNEGNPEILRHGERPLATFAYPESAAAALGRAADRAEWLGRAAGAIPALDAVDALAARSIVDAALASAGDSWLDPASTRALLRAYGLPMVEELTVHAEAEAVAAAARLGFPVVVKTAAAGAHKTESGGVALDLRDAGAVREAILRVGLPAIVQPMIRGECELLAGVVQDPVFGPLVAFGPGGVLAELIGDASIRIAPLTDVDAGELVHDGKAGRLVAGFRSGASDGAALVDLVHRLGRLAADLPEIAELDLNPVIGQAAGCTVVDARVRVRRPEPGPAVKTW
jgi:acyl-CoA synthetase (NDP forming)/RimJ/RimL family protein N-acetyltransferase